MNRKINQLSNVRKQTLFAIAVCVIGVGLMALGVPIADAGIMDREVYISGYLAGMIGALLILKVAQRLDVTYMKGIKL